MHTGTSHTTATTTHHCRAYEYCSTFAITTHAIISSSSSSPRKMSCTSCGHVGWSHGVVRVTWGGQGHVGRSTQDVLHELRSRGVVSPHGSHVAASAVIDLAV